MRLAGYDIHSLYSSDTTALFLGFLKRILLGLKQKLEIREVRDQSGN
jgi:hypothetical protein